jgi:hypothetical protein
MERDHFIDEIPRCPPGRLVHDRAAGAPPGHEGLARLKLGDGQAMPFFDGWRRRWSQCL